MKQRAAAKKAKAAPDGAAFLVAARALHKAQREAQGQENAAMDTALEAALAMLSKHAVESGLRMPVPRERKLPKRKKTMVA